MKREDDLFVCRVEWTCSTAGRTKSIVANNLYYRAHVWEFNDHVIFLYHVYYVIRIEKRVSFPEK